MEVPLTTPTGALENPTMQEIQRIAWPTPVRMQFYSYFQQLYTSYDKSYNVTVTSNGLFRYHKMNILFYFDSHTTGDNNFIIFSTQQLTVAGMMIHVQFEVPLFVLNTCEITCSYPAPQLRDCTKCIYIF